MSRTYSHQPANCACCRPMTRYGASSISLARLLIAGIVAALAIVLILGARSPDSFWTVLGSVNTAWLVLFFDVLIASAFVIGVTGLIADRDLTTVVPLALLSYTLLGLGARLAAQAAIGRPITFSLESWLWMAITWPGHFLGYFVPLSG